MAFNIHADAQTPDSCPYIGYMEASDDALRGMGFVFDPYRNCWHLSNSGTGAYEDIIIPSGEDLRITVQNGADGSRACLQVVFFNQKTYDSIVGFGLEKGTYFTESVVGTGKRCQFVSGGYTVSVEYKPVKGSIQEDGAAPCPYSYDRYVLTVSGSVPASSRYLDDRAAEKKASAESRRRSRMSLTD